MDWERVRTALITTALDLMSRQGVQHTTVEQVYKAVGISRTFFYTFFPSKEDLIVYQGSKTKIGNLIVGWNEASQTIVAVPTVPDLSSCGDPTYPGVMKRKPGHGSCLRVRAA